MYVIMLLEIFAIFLSKLIKSQQKHDVVKTKSNIESLQFYNYIQ